MENSFQAIENFINKYGYKCTVKDVVGEYRNYKQGYYIIPSIRHCIVRNVSNVRHLYKYGVRKSTKSKRR
ncbi:hypothetical protein [Clostridium tertium]|uniref:hypothetical protein n=1 Tax=Clostridium tertium TaxID=1559 RepID=UPI0023B2F895|nr:hypothetical protein [Clostridium tertium]